MSIATPAIILGGTGYVAGELLRLIAAHPQLLGLGIDEGTAIVVTGDRAKVIGASKLVVTDNAFVAGADGKRTFTLSPGETLDLATRKKVP